MSRDVAVSVFGRDDGPVAGQSEFLAKVLRDLPRLERAALDALTLLFSCAVDPQAEYYVDFENGSVAEAYRIG